MQTPAHHHGATAARPQHRPHVSAGMALPVTAAVVYGLYVLFLDHSNGGSWGRAALLALVAAVVTGALGLLLVRRRAALTTEVRALAFGALFGCAMGFLYSLTGPSVLRSVTMGVVLGGALALVSLYVFRAHEPHVTR
ncbi:hypothetical protein AB0I22_15650 [Streptomyces sp. NPDC050610]|uniref:hypothetical protein n=1 Tax=Streptomyces sp. NPDC050610 TaxID=3157097 RepID=UPI00343F1F26